MVEDIARFDVILVRLNPTVGSEIKKARPCVIISPDEMRSLKTLIVAPMTSKGFDAVFRVKIKFGGKNGLILLDQIRTIDKTRIVKKIGCLPLTSAKKVSELLIEIFQY